MKFINWYDSLYRNAELYDSLNINSLIKITPEYVSVLSEQFETFIYMLSQHYDILYTYINNMTRINSREENPKLGMPNELLYSVAKQFGWSLTNGN